MGRDWFGGLLSEFVDSEGTTEFLIFNFLPMLRFRILHWMS